SHFPREMTPEQIGAYVVNANLSDIAAMGAVPFGMLVSLGLPGDLDEDFVEGIARGMDDECVRNGIHILGGDTKEQKELIIVGTALGKVQKNRILTRGGAKEGDLICATGNLGSAAAGFYCLTNGIKNERLINAALEPKARVKEGIALSKYASACIDISDGLGYSLHEISKLSDVGFVVREEDIPVDRDLEKVAEAVNVSAKEMVFSKGGDYELLCTISPEKYDDALAELKELNGGLTVIGEITEAGGRLMTEADVLEDVEARGYDSFRNFQ
ncbi:MAG: thiamine-phosphate kinase, partial [Candidatus Hydrothermarchaeales archaeon]